jgi:hypothetical protein
VDAVDADGVGGAQHGAEVVGLVHVLGEQREVGLAVAQHLLDAMERRSVMDGIVSPGDA